MAAVIRSVRLLVLESDCRFIPGSKMSPSCHPSVVLHRDEWEDMGRPQEITVTIEPGDRLNEEGS